MKRREEVRVGVLQQPVPPQVKLDAQVAVRVDEDDAQVPAERLSCGCMCVIHAAVGDGQDRIGCGKWVGGCRRVCVPFYLEWQPAGDDRAHVHRGHAPKVEDQEARPPRLLLPPLLPGPPPPLLLLLLLLLRVGALTAGAIPPATASAPSHRRAHRCRRRC